MNKPCSKYYKMEQKATNGSFITFTESRREGKDRFEDFLSHPDKKVSIGGKSKGWLSRHEAELLWKCSPSLKTRERRSLHMFHRPAFLLRGFTRAESIFLSALSLSLSPFTPSWGELEHCNSWARINWKMEKEEKGRSRVGEGWKKCRVSKIGSIRNNTAQTRPRLGLQFQWIHI